MRIIRGKYKTRRYSVPKGFPSRPTTDFAKEGLFNILDNQLVMDDLDILDLCAGTGNISMEFLSREAGTVTAVDSNFNCVRHMKKMVHEYGCEDEIVILKSDVLKFLKSTGSTFDVIFADPPYVYEHYNELVDLVFERELLNEGGLLIVEHGASTSFEDKTQFDFSRKYGNVHFSFFKNEDEL